MCIRDRPNVSQNPKFFLEVDTLKSIIVFGSVLLWSAYLSPIGISIANWTTQCSVIPMMCITFSVLIICITISSVFLLDIKDAIKLVAKKKSTDESLKKKRKPNIPLAAKPNIYAKFFFSLILAASTITVPILLSIPLHDSKILRASDDYEYNLCDDVVNRVPIYLIIVFILVLPIVIILLIHYTIRIYEHFYLPTQRSKTDHDVEMGSMINNPLLNDDQSK